MGRKKKTKNVDVELKKRNAWLFFIGVVATVLFALVILKLSYIQFVKGAEYSKEAYNQQVKDQVINPNRGKIFDANGLVLAQSIGVDTVSLNPGKVQYSNGKQVDNKVIAEGLSEIFDISYEEMLDKINSKSSVVVVQKKVESDKIEKLQKWMASNNITTGINIDEDTKRSYPYNNLASNLIGYCGADNTGLFGLEERWNDVLTGTAGKVVTATDVNGKAITDEDVSYVPSENGSNIYLTIDANIQQIAERYLQQAVTENGCTKGGNVIVMNPQSGDILAMATYPNYNLNNPTSPENLGISEEEWQTMAAEDISSRLYELWKNRAVSGYYEPGSTFKLITASTALEENIVQTDTEGDFYCSGIQHVADKDIACWRKSNPHGSQSLRKAIENSCNPAFMQLGRRIGAPTLYKYIEAFGFMDPVGNDIAKAYKGDFYPLDKVGPVELATASFGQRFSISPLQLATAVCCICNDGYLVKPRIVKQIENTDTNSIEVTEVQRIRQVISKETSQKMKNLMYSVVEEGTGKRAKIEGYSIGGKSGTSEPPVGREHEGYVASFVAVSPIENTQVVVLVVLYDPRGESHQGGQTAGPFAGKIMSEVLPILGIASSSGGPTATVEQNNEKLTILPNLVGNTVSEARIVLQNLGLRTNLAIAGDESLTVITNQNPKPGATLESDALISLHTDENPDKIMVNVPNIKGMTRAEASAVLKAANLNINVDGTKGKVSLQDPTYDTQVEEGTVINVVIKEEIQGGAQ